MDSFNPLADVMRASVASLARNLGRTEQEIEAESAAVKMISMQAVAKVTEQMEKLSVRQDAEQQRRQANGLKRGTPAWKKFIAEQEAAMDSFNRILATLG